MMRQLSNLCCLCLLLGACNGDAPIVNRTRAAPPVAQMSQDVAALEKLINLQKKPSSVLFRREQRSTQPNSVPGPTDSSLTAVLRYSPEEADALCAEAATAAPEELQLPAAEWFPPELKALATPAANGRNVLRVKRYPAGSFTRAPYSNGVLMRVDDSPYFVLSMYST
jgi:hypothetical protein